MDTANDPSISDCRWMCIEIGPGIRQPDKQTDVHGLIVWESPYSDTLINEPLGSVSGQLTFPPADEKGAKCCGHSHLGVLGA